MHRSTHTDIASRQKTTLHSPTDNQKTLAQAESYVNPLTWVPIDHAHIRISHFGSKAQHKQDARNHGLQDPDLYTYAIYHVLRAVYLSTIYYIPYTIYHIVTIYHICHIVYTGNLLYTFNYLLYTLLGLC